MAEHADGSIVIDTEMDLEGFKAGSSKMQKAVKSMNTTFKNLGPTFQKALSGNISAISSFEAKAAALESTISGIKGKMESLAQTQIPTEHYQYLTDQIDKCNAELSKYIDRANKMRATGVKKDSRAWQSLMYDIDLAKRKIAEYEGEQASMRDNGTAFTTGKSTAEYAKLSNALASAKNQLGEMRAKVQGAKEQLAEMEAQAEKTAASTRSVGFVGKALKGTFSVVGKTLKATFSKIGSIGKKAIAGIANKLKGLIKMFGRMVIFKAIMAIINSVTEGFKNPSQYSTQTNADLSALKSSLTQLKNSFATAFAPILTVVTPALTKLIGYLSTAITYVGKFIAAMTGAKTFTQAKAVQEEYAASLGETGKAAKNAQKQLAGFDELNVLSKDSSDSGGSAGSVDPSEMFEEVPIESSITDFVSRIKEAFKNGDYASIGGVIAQGFNAAIDKLHSVFTDYDWPGLAAGLVQGLNGFVRGVDWGKLGTTLSTGVRTSLATMRRAITTFDWASLGKGVSDAINGIDWVGILSDLAGSISDIVKGALDGLIGIAENLDWGKLGRDLWNGLIGIITNIDWGGIISKAFRLLGNAIGGLTTLIAEFCMELWASLKAGFENIFKTYFEPYLNDMGKLTIEGFFKGIGDMFKDIGNWIVTNIWNPFITGFKNAFGIHSPSTKMAEMGGYIIQGLCNGIKNAWSSITGFFSNALNSIKTTLSNAWQSVKTTATTAWSGIKNTLSTAWNGIKTTASNTWNGLKTTISTGWNSIKTGATTAWTNIKSSLSTTWNSIKSTASTMWNSLKTTISNSWNSVKSTATTTWNGIKSSLSNTWNSIKSTASTTFDNIKNTIKNKGWSGIGSNICDGIKSGITSGWTALKNKVSEVASSLLDKAKAALGIHSPSRLFRDVVGLNIGYGIGEGIVDSEKSVVGKVSDLAGAIAAECNAGTYTFGADVATPDVNNAMSNFSNVITAGFTTLLDRLQSIANGVTFAVPAMATGTVVPYSVAPNGGAGSNVSTAFDASTERLGDELSSVIIQSVTNATAAVVDAIQEYSGTTVNLDANSLTSEVIKQINRRTMMSGRSPIMSR